MVAFRAVSQECADQPFYLMRDVICRALERLIVSSGHSPTRNELLHLEQLFWTAAIPTATPTDGAIETLTRLRDVGIRTGIVSYADITVFEALLKLTGLAGSTDVEVCSEMARSCKPHPEIFHQALCSVGVDPTEAMFVGDTVDTDIVGGNRVGMRTALLSAGEFTLGEGSQRRPGVTSRPPHRQPPRRRRHRRRHQHLPTRCMKPASARPRAAGRQPNSSPFNRRRRQRCRLQTLTLKYPGLRPRLRSGRRSRTPTDRTVRSRQCDADVLYSATVIQPRPEREIGTRRGGASVATREPVVP